MDDEKCAVDADHGAVSHAPDVVSCDQGAVARDGQDVGR